MTYLFAGDVDHASHAHGQESSEVTALLARIDAVIERRYEDMWARHGDVPLVVWSDHGHHDVQKLDPLELMRRHHIDLDRYPHVIDTNFIRVWTDDAAARERLGAQLDSTGVGRVLGVEELRHNRVLMDDDRYGDLVFYLELPYAFTNTIWGFGRRLASAHGYSPDHPRSDAVFVSNLPAREGPYHLVDVAPTILELLGLPVPAGLDGRSAWTPPGRSVATVS